MKHPPYTKLGTPADVIDGDIAAGRVMAEERRKAAGRKATGWQGTLTWLAEQERKEREPLLAGARRGDPAAAAELYKKFRAWIIR